MFGHKTTVVNIISCTALSSHAQFIVIFMQSSNLFQRENALCVYKWNFNFVFHFEEREATES